MQNATRKTLLRVMSLIKFKDPHAVCMVQKDDDRNVEFSVINGKGIESDRYLIERKGLLFHMWGNGPERIATPSCMVDSIQKDFDFKETWGVD